MFNTYSDFFIQLATGKQICILSQINLFHQNLLIKPQFINTKNEYVLNCNILRFLFFLHCGLVSCAKQRHKQSSVFHCSTQQGKVLHFNWLPVTNCPVSQLPGAYCGRDSYFCSAVWKWPVEKTVQNMWWRSGRLHQFYLHTAPLLNANTLHLWGKKRDTAAVCQWKAVSVRQL